MNISITLVCILRNLAWISGYCIQVIKGPILQNVLFMEVYSSAFYTMKSLIYKKLLALEVDEVITQRHFTEMCIELV